MSAEGQWLAQVQERLARGENVAVVTVLSIAGSAPRSAGARMVLGADSADGTIGGGNLEFEAAALARQLLAAAEHGRQQLEHYGLGPWLMQCCGGAVDLMVETFTAAPAWLQAAADAPQDSLLLSELRGDGEKKTVFAAGAPPIKLTAEDYQGLPKILRRDGGGYFLEQLAARQTPLWLFGAGHVGKAVVDALAPLPFTVTWLDSRAGMFPHALPAAVTKHCTGDLPAAAKQIPPDAFALVMTHSHPLDEDICAQLLRGKFAWLGLIGSRTKQRRFAGRLKKRGIPESKVHSLTCPIGIPGISDKTPAAIALSVAAQLLVEREKLAANVAAGEDKFTRTAR